MYKRQIHNPWKLEGAHGRIEKLRKGVAKLEFFIEGNNINLTTAQAKVELVNHHFNFGVSMTQVGPYAGTKYHKMYRDRVTELFNFVTLGFYWAARDERRNLSRYTLRMREKVNWAEKNNLKIKGHPLLWHESLPKWVTDFEDLEDLEKIIYRRIKDLILTYPEIDYWDVYNEPVAPFKSHVENNGVSRWIKDKGGIYHAMQELYTFVNKIDSTKVYSNNHFNPKDEEFLKLNEYFIDNNFGYSAIGMQAHMQTHKNVYSEHQLWDLLNTYEPLGKNIQFTEITVTSSSLFNDWQDHQVFLTKRKEASKNGKNLTLPSLAIKEKYQAAYLKDLYTLLFSHPSVSSITMWNFSDRNAWRGHAGGILDKEMQPKEAFYTLEKLIKETWSTKIISNFNFNDGIIFSGFYGTYKGTLNIGGKNYNFKFEHKPKSEEPIIIKIN